MKPARPYRRPKLQTLNLDGMLMPISMEIMEPNLGLSNTTGVMRIEGGDALDPFTRDAMAGAVAADNFIHDLRLQRTIATIKIEVRRKAIVRLRTELVLWEAELADVEERCRRLIRKMGHVYARHSPEMVKRKQLYSKIARRKDNISVIEGRIDALVREVAELTKALMPFRQKVGRKPKPQPEQLRFRRKPRKIRRMPDA